MPSTVVCDSLTYTLRLSPAEVEAMAREHWERDFVVFERGTWDAKKKSWSTVDQVRLRIGAISAVADAT